MSITFVKSKYEEGDYQLIVLLFVLILLSEEMG